MRILGIDAAPTHTYEGHASLGYAGDGVYRCECGEAFSVSDGALPMGTAVTGIKDQWNAHRRDSGAPLRPI